MPSVSKKQERFMQAVANNPAFAKKVGVPQSVGREFTKKEVGMKKKVKRYQDGGLAGIAQTAEDLMGNVDSMANTINYGSETPGGATQPVGFEAVAGMKKGGKVKKMAFGGLSGGQIRQRQRYVEFKKAAGMKAQPAPARNVGSSIAAAMRRYAANKAAMPASTTPRPGPFPGGKTASQMLAESKAQRGQTLKKGGAVKSASARADGIAVRGKTRA